MITLCSESIQPSITLVSGQRTRLRDQLSDRNNMVIANGCCAPVFSIKGMLWISMELFSSKPSCFCFEKVHWSCFCFCSVDPTTNDHRLCRSFLLEHFHCLTDHFLGFMARMDGVSMMLIFEDAAVPREFNIVFVAAADDNSKNALQK